MFYVEFLIDGEPYELDLHPSMVFTKCVRCGKKIYGYCHIGAEIEPLCDECNPPPDPKKKIIEYLKKHMGVTFTEEEMDTFLRRAISNYYLMRSTGGRRLLAVGKAVAPLRRAMRRTMRKTTIPL